MAASLLQLILLVTSLLNCQVFAKQEILVKDGLAVAINDYSAQIGDSPLRSKGYKHYNLSLINNDSTEHQCVRRSPGPNCLRVMTFNVQRLSNNSPIEKIQDIAQIISDAHLIAVQELFSHTAAEALVNQLDKLNKGNFQYVQAGPLGKPNSSYKEWIAFVYRTDLLKHGKHKLWYEPTGEHPRPPFVAEFSMTQPGCPHPFRFTVVTVHTQPKPSKTTKVEINLLYNVFIDAISQSHCYPHQGIILGDFNQEPNWTCELDKSAKFFELEYEGSSSVKAKTIRKNDRIYVTNGLIPGVKNPEKRAQVFRTFKNPSNHWPVIFDMKTYSDPNELGYSKECLEWLRQKEEVPNTRCTKRQRTHRQADPSPFSSCETYAEVELEGGVYPAEATSSSVAFGLMPTTVQRGDTNFWRMMDFSGSYFIFENEEIVAEWCGSPGEPCKECRGVSSTSIFEQCADRIMCPMLADKLLDLNIRVQSCFENRTIIIHQALDEPDSLYPNGRTPIDSLHRSGQEAEISMSFEIEEPIITQNYPTDGSLTNFLASMAVCVGFDYVHINPANNSVSVAVRDCFLENISVPVCQEPSLSNGKYLGPHKGPVFQYEEVITAICEPGFTMSGPITRQCVNYNQWSGDDPECIRVCSVLQVPDCSEVVFDYIQQTVTFKCQSGCLPSGVNAPLRCNHKTGEFEGHNTLLCSSDNSTCPPLVPPQYGYMTYAYGLANDIGSVALFSCQKGLSLTGQPILTCQSNSEWDHSTPTCTGTIALTEFTVPGFSYFGTNQSVNPFDNSSLASATYTGELSLPNPPFTVKGYYNNTSSRVVVDKVVNLPFSGLRLAYRVEVDLVLSEIVLSYFRGHLSEPFGIDVIGIYDAFDCVLELSSSLNVTSELITAIDIGLELEFCDNCTTVCSAQAVRATAKLHQPWDIDLNGSYTLENHVSSVMLGAAVQIQGINVDVFTSIQRANNQTSISELGLLVHIPPIGVDIMGTYSHSTKTAAFSGAIMLEQTQFMLQMTASLTNWTFSDLAFSGELSSPFHIMVFGSYNLASNTSNLALGGTVMIDSVLELSLTVKMELRNRVVLSYTLSGLLSQPLAVRVTAYYSSTLPTDSLELNGSVALHRDSHTIALRVVLNITSDPVSILALDINGAFPSPLDFITFTGNYHHDCDCAHLTGKLIKPDFTVQLSTNLTFQGNHAILEILHVKVLLHQPLDATLEGEYSYLNDGSNNSLVTVLGTFEILHISFNTELQVVLDGMHSLSIGHLWFTGTLPHPLSLNVTGDYNSSSQQVCLTGMLEYGFASLSATTKYQLVDVTHNRSASLQDMSLSGYLTSPFSLEIKGLYVFATASFHLNGSVSVGQFLDLHIHVGINTSTTPVTPAAVAVSGTLLTPIRFVTDFHGTYDASSQSTVLSSHLRIGSVLFNAKGTVFTTDGNFSLHAINISGTVDSPLSIFVSGTFIPSNSTQLMLMGDLSVGHFVFKAVVYSKWETNLNTMVVQRARISGRIDEPFQMQLAGTYMSGTSNVMLTSLLNLTDLVLQASAHVNLTEMPRRINKLDFTGHLQSPFKGIVKAMYTSPSEGRVSRLNLFGSLPIQNGSHAIALCVALNTSSTPVSIIAFELSGMFPPPFEFIQFTGRYNSQCQCAFISGVLVRDDFNICVTTTLAFAGENTQSIDSLHIQASFHRPLDLILDGTYFYQQNASQITLSGYFNLSEFSLKTQLQLNLDGMGGFKVSTLYFMGTLPLPLNLVVGGNYSDDSMQVCLVGNLVYNFAHFEATAKYQFRDDVHNMSIGLTDLSLHGALTNPFPLDLSGNYTFKTSQFHIMGTTQISEYLVMKAQVMLSTTTTPPRLDAIMFSGVLMTPIPFEGEFHGIFDNTTRRAAMISNLTIGSVLFAAQGNLILQRNNSFLLESVEITGTIDKPLSLYVRAVYIPSNNTDLMLSGNLTLGSVHDQFHAIIHAQKDSQLNQMVIRRVYFSGSITNPFRIELSGTYQSGDTMMLFGSTDLSIVNLQISANINLTSTPRMITSFEIQGYLKSPLRGNLSANYMPATSSGDIVLIGRTEVASFDFTLHVYLLTTPKLAVKIVEFITTFNPLSLKLIGVYNQNSQRVDLGATLSISTPQLNVSVTTSIDLKMETPSLDTLVLSANFHKVMLSGKYNETSQSARLHGVLTLGNINFSAVAVLHLRDNRYLDNVKLGITYKLPFGDMLQFKLEGVYNHSSSQVIVEGRILRNGSDSSNLKAILVVSAGSSPSTQLVSLNLDELDIASLLQTYLKISLPNGFFPLVFRNLAIYRAFTDITYNNVCYKVGFHARGEITIFTLPTFTVEASLITETQMFIVSLTLREAIDWNFFAICGTNCQMGPSLSVEVGSKSSSFILSGSFHLFSTFIASVDFAVSKERISACVTLSESIRELFFGLAPNEIKIHWNDNGFTTSLPNMNLDIPGFSLDNIATPDICKELGGIISKVLIDTPFHLNTSFVVQKKDNGFQLGLIFAGSTELRLAGQLVLTIPIRPIQLVVKLQQGDEMFTRDFFRAKIEEALKNASSQIGNEILSIAGAAALKAAGTAVQTLVGEAAESICNDVLEAAAKGVTEVAEVGATLDAASRAGGLVGVTIIASRIADIIGHDNGGRESVNEMYKLSCDMDNGNCEQICNRNPSRHNFVTCSCNEGFLLSSDGRSCIAICETKANTCDEHAVCMTSGQEVVCSCNSGFSGDGKTCTDIDECQDSSACPDHCMCSNTEGSFDCNAFVGYRHYGKICTDIDECAEDIAHCTENSHCQNTPGSYTCVCDMGYQHNGQSCDNVNECEMPDTCGPHSNCTDTSGSFTCGCDPGYKWNVSLCIDVDECTEDSYCDANAACTNNDGSFTCSCEQGYSGSGTDCTDIDECLTEDICHSQASCRNTDGSYTCTCNAGFEGNGTACQDINECNIGSANCASKADCANTVGYYYCTCLPGYTGDGYTCEDINECITWQNNCSINALCFNAQGSYKCSCNEGFEGDGFNCTDINECTLDEPACDEFATCANIEGSFNCTCNFAYTGNGDTCTLISCNPLKLPANSTYVVNDGNMFGQTVSVQCLPGFEPRDIFNLTCGADGEFIGSLPENCSEGVFCPEPNALVNGHTFYATPTPTPHVGSMVLYTCDPGYDLVGDSVLTCLESGMWSASEPRCEALCSNGDLRLEGGGSDSEGRVEMCHNGQWGTVCDDCWDDADALVSCKQLGHPTTDAVARSRAYFGPGTGAILLDDVNCTGNETRLIDCQHSPIWTHNCDHFEDAGVTCQGSIQSCSSGDLRLVGGSSDSEGRVEICFNNQWGTVCDDYWGTTDAVVTCRQLGYDTAVARSRAYFGRGTGAILLDDVNCTGNETRLIDCQHSPIGKHNCIHYEDAGVTCQTLSSVSCSNGDLQLVGGSSDSEGRVEVCYDNQWGTVCDDSWSMTDAVVTCRQLGYEGADARYGAYFGPGTGAILLDDVNCTGNETRLIDCQHSPRGEHNCDHFEDAGVTCQTSIQSCSSGDLRLVGGSSDSEGRVEICFNNQWGTVCDDYWGTTDAVVTCRQLGSHNASAVATSGAYFGPGTGAILLDDVNCTGNETRLIDCQHSPIWTHNCDHFEDAGVTCQTSIQSCSSGDLQLVGGSSDSEGRVEICFNNQWGTVCDDYWGTADAVVTCQQLGYPTTDAVARSGAYFGPGTGAILLDDVNCTGNETRLIDCQHSAIWTHNCDHSEDAGVTCQSLSPVSCEDGDLQLVGGSSNLEGRVEICFNNQWGTVCDDFWDDADALVTCRQLGHESGGAVVRAWAHLSPGTGEIHLDDVSCNGNEARLIDCQHRPIGEHNCVHFEDAAVTCHSCFSGNMAPGAHEQFLQSILHPSTPLHASPPPLPFSSGGSYVPAEATHATGGEESLKLG